MRRVATTESTVAHATTNIYREVPWVETHGYNHVIAYAVQSE